MRNLTTCETSQVLLTNGTQEPTGKLYSTFTVTSQIWTHSISFLESWGTCQRTLFEYTFTTDILRYSGKCKTTGLQTNIPIYFTAPISAVSSSWLY